MRTRGKRQTRKKTKKLKRNQNIKRTKKGGAAMDAAMPDELNPKSELWLSFREKLSKQGLTKPAIEFITRSHIHFLSLQQKKPELYERIRGYIAEFTSLEKLNTQDYPTLSIIFRKFMSSGGKLNYLTDTLNVLWELCAIYKPEMVEEMTEDQSLELFKDCLRVFFEEGYLLDRALVAERTPVMVDYMELWRGVRGANQKEVEKLNVGDSYQFLSLLSLSFDVNSATKFSDPSNPLLCLFKVEKGQAVPGIVVSTELNGPPSESEILTGAGFTANYQEEQKMEIGGKTYTVKVFTYIGTREVIDQQGFEKCLSGITFDEMNRMYSGEAGHKPPPERANELSETYLGPKGTGKLQAVFKRMARRLKNKRPQDPGSSRGSLFRSLEVQNGLARTQESRDKKSRAEEDPKF